MKKQKFFNFDFFNKENFSNFYRNSTNESALLGVFDNKNTSSFLVGPKKSGKSFLCSIWIKYYNALKYYDNFEYIINHKRNIVIEDIQNHIDEEKIFHIINHCKFNKTRIFITSEYEIDDINFSLKDLSSRIKSFSYFKFNQPDDDMLINILTKLFVEKQFVINSPEICLYILKRGDRSYEGIFNIVQKLDSLSLEKKRQLTIPLIKEIL